MTGPVYLSAEAVLEIDEFLAGLRSDVPSFDALVHALQTPIPSPTFQGNDSVSMLADVRSYKVLRDALGEQRTQKIHAFPEFHEAIVAFLDDLKTGVAAKDPKKLTEAKLFCIVLGNGLIKKQMGEAYQRRERSDSRYVSHDSLS